MSLACTGYAAVKLWSSGTPKYFTLLSSERLIAELEREAAGPNPKAAEARLAEHLENELRNWLVIDAMLAEITVSDVPLETLETARDTDHGVVAHTARCTSDASTCSLENLMICRVPLELTPLEDITSLASAAISRSTGQHVD